MMKINASDIVKGIGSYAFADVENEVAKLKNLGIKPIDFGVGDPMEPTPGIIRNYCKRALDKRKSSGYPSYIGDIEYRKTIAKWTDERFRVSVDSETEICSTIGSKEAVFNFPLGFINPGDYVLMPNPGYPPYERGTTFAGGKSYFMPLKKENNFLPNLEEIPVEVVKKSKIMWLNYPNNPTTAMAPKSFYKEAIDFAKDNNIIIASDECYTELYYDEKPLSILELEREGIIVFQSLSKRSNMTTYRSGWVMGDERVVSTFKKVKTNIDSGTPTFIQDASCAALLDEKHVEEARSLYRKKRDILTSAFKGIGLPDCTPKSTIYIWQKTPEGVSSVDFAKMLLDKDIGIVSTPGAWISNEVDGFNPGEGFVRLALVPTIEDCKKAAEKVGNLKF